MKTRGKNPPDDEGLDVSGGAGTTGTGEATMVGREGTAEGAVPGKEVELYENRGGE